VLSENFSGGIPGTWTVVDGGSGGGTAATWTTANPGSRTFTAPLVAPVAVVDSDFAGSSATQDEQLITPVLNLSTALTAAVDFDQYFNWYSLSLDEKGDVDVKSSLTGGAWVNVLRMAGADGPIPDHRTVNITAQAAGAADVQIRFHYYTAQYEMYWYLDNVVVSYTAPAGCNMTICPASGPPPVPNGIFGTGMGATKTLVEAMPDALGINLTWDTSRCVSGGYHVIYGPLATVSTYAVSGGVCGIGATGSYHWTPVPAASIWFVVVGDDGTSLEGSWGYDSSNQVRNGGTPSGQCGMTTRIENPTCP